MSRRALVLMSRALVASIVGVAAAASAHSFPEQETPSAGATLTAPPTHVSIKYDAPIEKLFASLEVLNSTGQNVAVGQPEVSPDGWNLSVRLNNLQPGEYTVQWRVVCIDTHHTQGSYSFTVERPNS
jgi:methionine-rich copper-binding protein CopC